MSSSGSGSYTSNNIRRSLTHFLLGKIVSALIGIGSLLFIVRVLSKNDYGNYIVLLATLEIVQIISNAGAMSVSFRYIPELRNKCDVRSLNLLISKLVIYNLTTLILISIIISYNNQYISYVFGSNYPGKILSVYCLVIITECIARLFDIIFDSLLLQGYTQINILLRNGIRLAGLIIYSSFYNNSLSLLTWIRIEFIASLTGAIVAVLLLTTYLRKLPRNLPDTETPISLKRVWRFAAPSYLAQIFWLGQGPDIVKLFVSKLEGVVNAGVFGFATALTNMLQRYLPAFLLIGMVRPLFVTATHKENSKAVLVQMAGLVFKLNILMLAPVFAIVVTFGDEFTRVLSGGKFPEASNYLIILLILLVFQTLYTVLGLLALAAEDGRASLIGAAVGLLGIIFGLTTYKFFGPLSLCFGMVISEILRCIIVGYRLRTLGFNLQNDWIGSLKILIAATVAIVPSSIFFAGAIHPNTIDMLITATIAISCFLITAFFIKPFNSTDRELIIRIYPRASMFIRG